MKTPDTIAQECILLHLGYKDEAQLIALGSVKEYALLDRLTPIIAAAIREAIEHELATINAERAETRDIRKEMIKAQDEVAKLRLELETEKLNNQSLERRLRWRDAKP